MVKDITKQLDSITITIPITKRKQKMGILNRDNLENYIKEVAFMISCFPHLDPRDHVREKRKSLLFDTIQKNKFQIDASVSEVVALLVKDTKFCYYLHKYIHEKEDDDDDDDEIEFFHYTMTFIGLHTLFTMHEDTIDYFQHGFFLIAFN